MKKERGRYAPKKPSFQNATGRYEAKNVATINILPYIK